MESLIVNSLKNRVICALAGAFESTNFDRESVLSRFIENVTGNGKVFLTLILYKKESISDFDFGRFVQAIFDELKKSGMPAKVNGQFKAESVDGYADYIAVDIYKPTRMVSLPENQVVEVYSDNEKIKEKCLLKPEKTYEHKINVRFRDLDAMGHVSNNIFLVYLEEARVGFRSFASGKKKIDLDFCSVVASHWIEYLAPIFLGESLVVEIWISHLTAKSYRFNYIIKNPETGQVKALAYTQMVGYDYREQKVKDLPQSFFETMKDYTV